MISDIGTDGHSGWSARTNPKFRVSFMGELDWVHECDFESCFEGVDWLLSLCGSMVFRGIQLEESAGETSSLANFDQR